MLHNLNEIPVLNRFHLHQALSLNHRGAQILSGSSLRVPLNHFQGFLLAH
ncbi:Uncharacterised protein [Vibrio cholerae]|nr:Uncharacterised protein [Vibrio cholerae]